MIAALAWLSGLPVQAQTGYPMVSRVVPAAVQRGTSVELTFGSSGNGSGDFSGAFAVLCEGTGLKGEVLSVEKPAPRAAGKAKGRGTRQGTGMVKVRLTASPDALLGPREIRVATAQGASSVGLVVVVNDPVVSEADDKLDDDVKGAQALTLPCVVSGAIGKAEDVDWYAVPVKGGQRITFSVWANRLENKIHDLQLHFDPILILHDASGRELAADDNHDLADPLLSYEFKNDGTYYLQVRDTTYGGNLNWTYVLQATTGPVATTVFPLAVNPGTKAELHAKGPNIDPNATILLDVPAALSIGPQLVSLPTANGPTLARPVFVTRLPIVLEKDDTAEDVDKAQSITLPAAACGHLGSANDTDAYRFEAKKDVFYDFEIVARRLGASIDPVLKLVDSKGKVVAESDDTSGLGKDARIEWKASGDGVFSLIVSDLHSRGGDDFGYALQARLASPDFTLTCDPDKINVGPGGRVPLFVQITRHAGFDGPVTINPGTLPTGVLASPLVIGPKMSQGLIVVSADKTAEPTAALMALTGKAETAAGAIVRDASPRQEIYMPGGGRSTYPVETFALAVTDPSDITIEASTKTVSLKPGGSATIDVTVTRRPGFEQGVNLAVVLQHLGGIHANPLPPGVTMREEGSKTLLGPKESKGKIVLTAAPGAAAIENVPVCVMGHVSINFVVKMAYASEPIAVSVSP